MLRPFLLAFALLLTATGSAKVVTDTWWSSSRDRVILSYDITEQSGHFTVRFNSAKKRLSTVHREEYEDNARVVPMFFDQTGGYTGITLDGLTPRAFMRPAGVGYDAGQEEHYFKLNESPTLSLSLSTDKTDATVSIPIYLAYYEKKNRYKIFAQCGNLDIRLERSKSGNQGSSAHSEREHETVIETETVTSDVESDNQDLIAAVETVKRVEMYVAMADRLPLSENLIYDVGQLRSMRSKISGDKTLQLIEDALSAYDDKYRELQATADAKELAAQAKAEQDAQRAQREQQAKADSIAAATQKQAEMQAEKSQKRTICMIIGGAILAVLCFVGNQVSSHFRNLSNQRSMQEMQDRMVKQAESDAKRRAQSLAHNKIHQARNAARNAARNSAREAVNGIKTKKAGSKSKPKTI